jgi:hypothetical protein
MKCYASIPEDTDRFVVELAAAGRGMCERPRSVKVALMGASCAGRSTLVNAFFGAITGSYAPIRPVGSGFDEGKRSKAMTAVPLLQLALSEWPSEAKGFEYVMQDFVAHRSPIEMMATLLGYVQSGEAFPDPTDIVGLKKLLSRRVGPHDAACCGMLLVPASVLISSANPPQDVADAVSASNAFTANLDDAGKFPLPLVLVVTRVDEVNGVTDPEALLRPEPMRPLYARAEEWGFSAEMTVPIGFLGGGHVDYADPRHPCVKVLKRLMLLTARSGRLFLDEVEDEVGDGLC